MSLLFLHKIYPPKDDRNWQFPISIVVNLVNFELLWHFFWCNNLPMILTSFERATLGLSEDTSTFLVPFKLFPTELKSFWPILQIPPDSEGRFFGLIQKRWIFGHFGYEFRFAYEAQIFSLQNLETGAWNLRAYMNNRLCHCIAGKFKLCSIVILPWKYW